MIKGWLLKGLGVLTAAFGVLALWYKGVAEKARRQAAERNIKAARAREKRVSQANKALHKTRVRSKKRVKDNKFNLDNPNE